mmetsp:Transcript_135439/g.235542  ORF Transcript_135439/g.235542 Transcript_135439/m.235542 type:complete len:208 (-) Transcript_135439:92-715(-)
MSTSGQRTHQSIARALLLATLLALQVATPGTATRDGQEAAVKSAAKARRVTGARSLRARAARAARERAAERAVESSASEHTELAQVIQKLGASPSNDFTGTGPPLGLAETVEERNIEYILPGDRGFQNIVSSQDDHKWLGWLNEHGLAPEKKAAKGSFHPEEWLPGAVQEGSLPDSSMIPKESHGVFLDYPPDGTDIPVVRPLEAAP